MCAVAACIGAGVNASGPAVLAERVLPSELRPEDEFLIVNDAGANTVSVNPAGSRLAPTQAGVTSLNGKRVLTSFSDDAAVFRLE
ncbi:MAG: hypothetical protein IKI42_05315 [Clostridia bacterium]|nr:hypothetical protein [Clostridia bacterium]